ncbi:hypothetical protein BJ875DRAFT_220652 [Amylocarpus encephaloides]|uniref:LysM domain-containing protein n=1 Tax=Amylocarpus encephaloides TaxID=45428 RepID=A0A9P7YT29_9HELO|nr:hypothetical protein BJ875DRAFT_220652 [Amylocarpus encephaloides]
MAEESCATCAQYLRNIPPVYDEKSEKPVAQDRRLDCCGRVICGSCIAKNSRFATYCPFCQVSATPSSLPQGLRDPPSYTPPFWNHKSQPSHTDDELPTYSTLNSTMQPLPERAQETQPHEDVLHFLDHEIDTLNSLSLKYGVPISALRRSNNITSDHLLLARRTIIIPGEFYKGGLSLSPRPVEGEEEESKKALVRKWMVACKVSEYDVALIYLKQSTYDLDAAITTYKDDERWELEHPIEANMKAKGRMKHGLGKRRFTGQRS